MFIEKKWMTPNPLTIQPDATISFITSQSSHSSDMRTPPQLDALSPLY